MRQQLCLLAVTALLFAGCNDHSHDHDNCGKKPHKCPPVGTAQDSIPSFIAIDSANEMISSYLMSINAPQNDTDLQCLIYSADSLRAYLGDTAIKSVKLILAHTLHYINNGGRGQYAGYQSNALTMVVAGYDRNGNYVYHNNGQMPPVRMVMDHAMPCPSNCPRTGTATSDLLQSPKR